MCGIFGFLDKHSERAQREDIGQKMADLLTHRGPDSRGFWTEGNASLGHTRLAVIDLSDSGHQPMISSSGRYVLSYNGEIYNHEELKKMLPGPFKGHSDTEVILSAIEEWGLEGTLAKLIGMFALAVWDKQKRALFLARDRMGEKPLYYGFSGGVFFFSSEIRTFSSHPLFEKRIDIASLDLFLRYCYVPAPRSIYQGIQKLLPGHFLEIPESASVTSPPQKFATPASQSDPNLSATDNLDRLLKEVVSSQMKADVPYGAFLSGGIDSTTVVSIMQSLTDEKIRTFTVGFSERELDESQHAKTVAKFLNTHHTTLYIDQKSLLQSVEKMAEVYDEPFADSSQIPTYLLSQLTREHVTVSLSGDGGDEIFCGYNRYFWGPKVWRAISRLPLSLRKTATLSAQLLSESQWQSLYDFFRPAIPQRWQLKSFGQKMHKLARVLDARTPAELYFKLITHALPTSLVLGTENASSTVLPAVPANESFAETMMAHDQETYLPDDILVKVDRATMAHSLESRSPFLDVRIVEFAKSLSLNQKVQNQDPKWLLKQVLYRYVPQELMERPKQGFAVPVHQWLNEELKTLLHDQLAPERIKKQGLFAPQKIQALLARNKKGDAAFQLWNLLMFQNWIDKQ